MIVLRFIAISVLSCCFYRQVIGEMCGGLFCYNVISGGNRRRNWDEANASCVSMGMSLALRNIVNDFSTALSNPGGDQFWIGLRRDDGNSDFIWNDGVMLTDPFQGGNDGDCGSIHNGHLHRRRCTRTQNYICQRKKETVTGELCGDLFCYNVISEERNWDEANASCAEMGMSLALRNILDDFSTVLSNPGGQFWIGLRRDDDQSNFIWNDGVMRTRSFNMGGSNDNDGDCGSIHNGHLHQRRCTRTQNYICQRMKETVPTQTPTSNIDILPTQTPTSTPTLLSTQTPTLSPTPSPTLFSTQTSTSSPTLLSTPSPTLLSTQTPSSTPTLLSTQTPTLSPTPSPTLLSTQTSTPSPTLFSTPTAKVEVNCSDSNNESINCVQLASIITQQEIKDIQAPEIEGLEGELSRIGMSLSIQENTVVRMRIQRGCDVVAYIAVVNVITQVNIGRNSITTQPDSFANNTIIVAVSINNSNIRNITNSSFSLISDLIIIEAANQLIGNLTVTFGLTAQDSNARNTIKLCAFFTPNISIWDTEGITTEIIDDGRINCITNHLTTFGVLVRFSPNPSGESNTILAYIGVVLCGSSLLALVISLILYFCVGKKFFKKEVNIIQLNYVIALILALIGFLVLSLPYFAEIPFEVLGDAGCKVITFYNHYFWLCVFSWSFCQAFNIILVLFSYKLPNRRYYGLLMLIGWGFPVPIVLITLGVSFTDYFNSQDQLCFLNPANGTIWAFLGPAYFIIMVNIGIMSVVIIITLYVQRNRKMKKYSHILKSLIIGTLVTLPLLGIPWIAGILPNIAGLTNNAELEWLEYIFVILNASQGVIFFFVHVVRNEQVRTSFFKNFRKTDIENEPDGEQQKNKEENC